MKRVVRALAYAILAILAYIFIVGFASEVRAEEPGFVCSAQCTACVECTAVFLGEDAWPKWSASVKEGAAWKETFNSQGLVSFVPVDRRWTRITMTVEIDGKAHRYWHMFRRPHTTGPFEQKPYVEGQ